MSRTISIIPARGGSKGIPRKNIVPLGGKPLLAYSIETSLACPLVDRTIVSTDDEEIASVARLHGAEVPFLRPADLARDDTVDYPVFLHALNWLAEHEDYRADLVVHLRPTSPFRASDLIERALVKLAQFPEADCLRTINPAPITPYKLWQKEGEFMRPFAQLEGVESYNMPRQDLPPVYWHNGVLDVIRSRTILEQGSISGSCIVHLEMDEADVVDIDSQQDLARAEFLLASAKGKTT
jgi:N-acylneuraminate cytidylyltransferase